MTDRVRSFTALVNPISGGGVAAQRWRPLGQHLADAGAKVKIELTKSAVHARELATQAAGRGDIVVAVGGDGLVRDAAHGVVAVGGTLAIVPAGRGNDMARKLDIPTDPSDPAAFRRLADLLLSADPKPLDVLEVNGSIVPGNMYAGIDSVAARLINKSRWLPGRVAYRLAPVRALITWRPPTYTLVIDGESITTLADTIVVANSGAYGHGLRIVPDALLDDGLLDVMIVGAGTKWKLSKFMREAKTGAHVHRAEVRMIRSNAVSISADRPVPVGVDGDELGELPCTVVIRPNALCVLAP